jgi:F420H(2)-dependent quinone reductase
MSRSNSFGDRMRSRFTMALPARVLRTSGKLSVPIYRLSRGRLLNKLGRAPILLLTTTGRRSGELRTAPVLYLRSGEHVAIIGSNAGNVRAPAWAFNLQTNPDAEIQIRSDRRPVRARVAGGEERADLWRRMTEQYPGFDDYDERTDRDIFVFVLEPRGSAA